MNGLTQDQCLELCWPEDAKQRIADLARRLEEAQQAHETVIQEWKAAKHEIEKLHAEAEVAQQAAMQSAKELAGGLNRAAYALFQIKRMTPESIREFASKEHEAACEILNRIYWY